MLVDCTRGSTTTGIYRFASVLGIFNIFSAWQAVTYHLSSSVVTICPVVTVAIYPLTLKYEKKRERNQPPSPFSMVILNPHPPKKKKARETEVAMHVYWGPCRQTQKRLSALLRRCRVSALCLQSSQRTSTSPLQRPLQNQGRCRASSSPSHQRQMWTITASLLK